MKWFRTLRRTTRGETGIAMVTAITVIALIATLAFVTVGVATTNLRTSSSDRLGASAMASSEAGVAHAIAYVKANGVGKIKCAPACGTANPWGEAGDDGDAHPPMRVTISPSESYDVWFETLQAMNAAGKQPGVYRIVSVGTANPGPGARRVEVDLEVSPVDFPIGVFANTVDGGGNPGIHYMSMFTTGCVTQRSKIEFAPVKDLIYGFPASVHSSAYITDSNNGCAPNDKKNIHNDGACPSAYKHDEDALASSCYGSFAGPPPYTLERISSADALAAKYDFNPSAFTDDQLEALRQVAISQGMYFTDTTDIPASVINGTAPYSHPVLFYDLAGSAVGGTVDLKHISDHPTTGWGRRGGTVNPLAVADPACTGRNIVVIVRNGDVRLNSNTMLNAFVFALGPFPYGEISKVNGTAQLFGTLFGTHIDMTGTADMRMDQCALESMAGALLSVETKNFREVDR